MKAVQVTSKHAIIHIIAKEFGVNVEFLDRRWWEFRPRMRVTIPTPTLTEIVKTQGRVLTQVINRGYSPGVHIRMVEC